MSSLQSVPVARSLAMYRDSLTGPIVQFSGKGTVVVLLGLHFSVLLKLRRRGCAFEIPLLFLPLSSFVLCAAPSSVCLWASLSPCHPSYCEQMFPICQAKCWIITLFLCILCLPVGSDAYLSLNWSLEHSPSVQGGRQTVAPQNGQDELFKQIKRPSDGSIIFTGTSMNGGGSFHTDGRTDGRTNNCVWGYMYIIIQNVTFLCIPFKQHYMYSIFTWS